MVRAYIFINTKPGTSEEVVARIKKNVKEVVQADSIYGRFDAVVMIEAPNLESINEILYKVIERDPNILHTETSLTLSS
ncbi:MAG: Lrp/AsnC ligand binding domain-containing protein [Candidatus Bathyarchaeota archaeon]|nr:Lrp/AsnC ligand binding domain-containing protein [Candidatus Bathyarchaeota archaeon]MCX8177782.1 Lrp/AsnC ligand binding domain-containing protein [Candidatus Bathyarchaeota archaeon]MDW8194046.1 Lrp/AsnC ligand binding domain-containing protein [Nitrososphaerota archaeon]